MNKIKSVAILNWGANCLGSSKKDVFVKYVYQFSPDNFTDDYPTMETVKVIKDFCESKGLNLYSY